MWNAFDHPNQTAYAIVLKFSHFVGLSAKEAQTCTLLLSDLDLVPLYVVGVLYSVKK